MTAVLAIDPSSERTGVALPDGTTVAWVPVRSTLTRPERLSAWERTLAATLRRFEPDVVVYEDIGGGGSRFRLAAQSAGGLRALAEVACYRAGVPMVLVGATPLKRYATGNGGASKEDMLAAGREAHLALDGGARYDGLLRAQWTHDEADAWLLRALAVHALDGVDLLEPSQGADPGHRLEVIAAHTWPKVPR